MDDQRVGAIFRAVRRRRRLRQLDVAARAGVHQSAVARLEAGHLARLRVETIRGIAAALEIAVPFAPRWHGADLARLLDQDHAALVESQPNCGAPAGRSISNTRSTTSVSGVP
ncbi:MAG: helix-turn-helix transcriptional regulator [Chloroflexi bacterium]|nr:helix-turn-helix transcriptional regulator [Chloroflexota bacterium]